ncbi:MAG: DNA polymerase III subunit delta [Bacteroidales bacterium]|nr:DNA polymerase III subunit delta [Candidatus Physcousia equi]
MAAAKQSGTSYDMIIRDVKAGNFVPIYYLMGEEDYYIDRISDFIVNTVLREDERDFNLDILYGAETSANQVIQFAQGLPMMAKHRVVLVREAQALNDRENLVSYLEHYNPSTVLIICHKHGKLDARRGLAKSVQKLGVLFESKRLMDYQLAGFVSTYLSKRKVDCEPAAAQMLAEYVGSDLNRLASEMDKLLLAMPQGALCVTPALVEEQTGVSKDYNNFELQNALAARDVLKANKIVKYFNKNPRSFALPLTLASLFPFFSDVLQAYYAPAKDENSIASWLGKSPWQVRQAILPAMKNYKATKVMQILAEIRRTDAKGKGVGSCHASPGDLLCELVYFILH